jgi:hypothetical protein
MEAMASGRSLWDVYILSPSRPGFNGKVAAQTKPFNSEAIKITCFRDSLEHVRVPHI